MNASEFFQFRVSRQITSAEIAHRIGCAVSLMLKVETGREAVRPYMVKAVEDIARERGWKWNAE